MMRSNRNGALCKETRDWGIEHRVRSQESEVRVQKIDCFVFLISKLGTRLKGGSPKDNFKMLNKNFSFRPLTSDL